MLSYLLYYVKAYYTLNGLENQLRMLLKNIFKGLTHWHFNSVNTVESSDPGGRFLRIFVEISLQFINLAYKPFMAWPWQPLQPYFFTFQTQD